MKYKNPTPVAVGLLPVQFVRGTALVCIVRGIDPCKGGLALPGGYVDELESVEVAVARELREELAFESDPQDWAPCASATNVANRMLVFCQFKRALTLSEFHQLERNSKDVSDEVLGVHLLRESDLETPRSLAFPLHQAAAVAYFQRERDAHRASDAKSKDVLDRLLDRGDIDETTHAEMLTEVAQILRASV